MLHTERQTVAKQISSTLGPQVKKIPTLLQARFQKYSPTEVLFV